MSKTIEAKFVWSEVVALLSSELFYKYEFRHSYRRYVGWLFIAMAQFGVVGALKHDAYGMLVLSSFLLVYWYAVRWQLRRRLALRLFKSSPQSNREITTVFDDVGLEIEGKKVPWSDVVKVVEKGEGFLFYTQEQSSFFPKEAFSSSDDRDTLRAMITKAKIVFEKEL